MATIEADQPNALPDEAGVFVWFVRNGHQREAWCFVHPDWQAELGDDAGNLTPGMIPGDPKSWGGTELDHPDGGKVVVLCPPDAKVGHLGLHVRMLYMGEEGEGEWFVRGLESLPIPAEMFPACSSPLGVAQVWVSAVEAGDAAALEVLTTPAMTAEIERRCGKAFPGEDPALMRVLALHESLCRTVATFALGRYGFLTDELPEALDHESVVMVADVEPDANGALSGTRLLTQRQASGVWLVAGFAGKEVTTKGPEE